MIHFIGFAIKSQDCFIYCINVYANLFICLNHVQIVIFIHSNTLIIDNRVAGVLRGMPL